MRKILFVAVQYLLPHHLLSRTAGLLARCRIRPVRSLFIRWFIRRYRVDMNEAEISDPSAYSCFNSFFTRALREGARPMPDSESIVASPADGIISQLGPVRQDALLQAKGRHFTLAALLGGDRERCVPFRDGRFFTVYLSPRDYHRVHMPLDGTLLETHYIPGRLFSVNQATTDHVPGLFARNERLVCLFDTGRGPMAVVLVGAMIVAGIETVWAGQVCPGARKPYSEDFRGRDTPVQLPRGGEMGRFKLGSTVIVLFGDQAVEWREDLKPGDITRMGQPISVPLIP